MTDQNKNRQFAEDEERQAIWSENISFIEEMFNSIRRQTILGTYYYFSHQTNLQWVIYL